MHNNRISFKYSALTELFTQKWKCCQNLLAQMLIRKFRQVLTHICVYIQICFIRIVASGLSSHLYQNAFICICIYSNMAQPHLHLHQIRCTSITHPQVNFLKFFPLTLQSQSHLYIFIFGTPKLLGQFYSPTPLLQSSTNPLWPPISPMQSWSTFL